MSKIIDCRGLKCPEPVIQTKKYFESINEGEGEIIVDNEVAKNNILKYCKNIGYKVELKEQGEGYYRIIANKELQCKCEDISFNNGTVTLVISTNEFGEGSKELGTMLMKSYMFALSESDKIPENIIFLNSGVLLTTKGSEVLDSLRKLQEKGSNILSCGMCLDYYNLKDKLEVGEISNMYTIVEKMNSSNNTIKL